VRRDPHAWHFSLGADAGLVVECPWRIIARAGIALGSVDDHQQFGLPAPVDAEAVAGELLGGREVIAAEVRAESADLVLTFEGERRLELFNNSSGYEGWTLNGADGRRVIAQGGGTLVTLGG
jgi:hypothetical protein